jgi:hypothetical protein
MAKLPPPRGAYDPTVPMHLFDSMEGKALDGRLALVRRPSSFVGRGVEEQSPAVYELACFVHGLIAPPTLPQAEIWKQMSDANVAWKVVGLDPPSLEAAMTAECRLNGDTLMSWADFWNFCLLNGTGHAVDPAEKAKDYLLVRATPSCPCILLPPPNALTVPCVRLGGRGCRRATCCRCSRP